MGLLGERVEPVCPICDGPCTHPFPRGPYVFPDRLPHHNVISTTPLAVPPPRKTKKPKNQRGKRLDRDRMIHGPERTTAVTPGQDR